jgi:hypothetical protein
MVQNSEVLAVHSPSHSVPARCCPETSRDERLVFVSGSWKVVLGAYPDEYGF